jgi:alkanesulfonate monooxygenase SsuD/methylene tetrahydromethanopterin reductase-like flavin-dependent oxidoreductase (luciferase family)
MATAIKFGYMVDFRNPPGSRIGFAELYAVMFRQIEFAEQAGFDSIWVTEHHFTDDGYLPAVMPMLSAIAARTRRVTIGSYVLLAPFYHPLRLAEDAAVVDVISNGRLRLGIGTAYRDEEFNGFEVSRKQRLGRTLETIEILRRAWTGEPFSFEGKYFRFHDLRVLPRPVSRPHPEILWAGMTEKAIQRGAELGLSFACNLGLREVELYRNTLRQLERIRRPSISCAAKCSTWPTAPIRRGPRSRGPRCIRPSFTGNGWRRGCAAISSGFCRMRTGSDATAYSGLPPRLWIGWRKLSSGRR